MDKIEKAQYQLNMRRAKVRVDMKLIFVSALMFIQEAQRTSFEAMQMAVETQVTNVPVTEVPVSKVDSSMEVDAPQARGTKREAEDEPIEMSKKAKVGQYFRELIYKLIQSKYIPDHKPMPLKRCLI